MSGPLTIRRALPEDYTSVCRLLEQLDDVHRERLPWLFRAPELPPRNAAFLEQLLSGEGSSILVADVGRLVGVAEVLLRAAPAFPVFVRQTFGVVESIFVEPDARRRGGGTALAHAAEEWARERGAAWVELGVYEFNDVARRFYESLGYET